MFAYDLLRGCAVLVDVSISPICVCYRLGVIEEEREEDERKLSVAIAAAERMNTLVRRRKPSKIC